MTNQVRLKADLNWRDGSAIVAGTVIGSGIFLVPGSIAREIPSIWPMMAVWLLGGLLTLFGALSVAELGAAFPEAGGLYVYLHAGYGRVAAFLYGWGLLTLIHSGSLAALAVAFGLYCSQLMPMPVPEQKAVAIVSILAVTVVNYFGLHAGKLVQNLVTASKIGGIGILTIALFIRGDFHRLTAPAPTDSGLSALSVGAALVAVLWAYEGWHVVSFTAGEFRNPARDLPKSLSAGILAVVAAYLLANLSYFTVLSPTRMQATDRAAATAMNVAYGAGATGFVTLLIVVSILGSMNGTALTGPRVYFAMARDGLFFPGFGRLNPRTHAPSVAIVVQGVWASCLTLAGGFRDLFTYVIFTAWIFYGATVLAVIILRVKRPDLHRPYRVPGYPWLPGLFVIAAGLITAIAIANGPRHALYGIGLILLGMPVYLLLFRQPGVSPKNE